MSKKKREIDRMLILIICIILIVGILILYSLFQKSLKAIIMNRNTDMINNSLKIVVPVLSYHQIGNYRGASTIVNLTNFAEQMAELNSNGFYTITYDQWYNWTKGLRVIPEKSIIIVFDDGWEGVYTNAIPIMDRYGYIGIMGVITNYVPKLRGSYMNWGDIQDLSNKRWQIASHSVSHLDMTTLNYTQRQLEFSNSKNDIAGNISITPTLFIFPYNSDNYSIDNECANYYSMCSGSSVGTTNSSKEFLFENANYTNEYDKNNMGLKRIIITNNTTPEQFNNILIATKKYNEVILNKTL
jgi:peptidoglycan/xylan/chitin deacetylase (PgdA/CDA1 family)